jgi:hypothetical protein
MNINFNKILSDNDSVLDTILKESADVIYDESKRRVPVDTGALKASAIIENKKQKEYRVSFKEDYAVYVHEDLSISHPIHGNRDCGGEAKFLERAMLDMQKVIMKNFKNKMKGK